MESEAHPRLKRQKDLNFEARFDAFAYQLQAVEAVKKLPFAALFHEQGLGKTKIGIDLALEWLRNDAVDAVLFITKRALVQNWVDEIHAHAHLKPRVLDQNHASNFYALNSATPIYVAHYEVMRSEERRMTLFLKTRRVAAILDEAHKIKNPDAEVTKALFRLAPHFVRRVIMTGTPVANRPFDLWSQVFFLDQGESLGTDFAGFKDRLDLRNDLWEDDRRREEFETELASVFRRIRPFTVRETKSSAGIELPKKQIENVSVELEPRQRELYDNIRTELRASVVIGGQVVEDDAEEILKRLLRLVQVASNPALIDESYQENPGKLKPLVQLIDKAMSAGSKVIVWTSFVDNADWLARKLKHLGAARVHGRLAIDDRNAAIAKFKSDNDCRVLVATPGAAKEGLTLTVANHAIFYDRSFSLDDYLQAQDRIHRISQTQTCYVWNLIAKDTVDEWVDSLLAAKRLAAQLAQADIDREEYEASANYEFGRVIKTILGAEN
jgi:SNF2 family DNA or RNA helicase